MHRFPKNTFTAKVVYNAPLRKKGYRHNYLMRFEIDKHLKIQPGHFLEINPIHKPVIPNVLKNNSLKILNLPENSDLNQNKALISRPISVANTIYHKNKSTISIIYKVVGPWTEELSKLKPEGNINVVGPLGGSTFSIMPDCSTAILIAGGVGLPPLLLLAKNLLAEENYKQIYLLVGAGTSDELPLPQNIDSKVPEEFLTLKTPKLKLMISTDDGSEGHKGFVTELAESVFDQLADKNVVFYTCGPKIMMGKVAELAEKFGKPCYVSLEERMACGIGACQSCVVKLKSDIDDNNPKYLLCCQVGPVFPGEMIDWQSE